MKVVIRGKGFEEIKQKNNFVKYVEKYEVDRIFFFCIKRNICELVFCNDFKYFFIIIVFFECCDRYFLDDC